MVSKTEDTDWWSPGILWRLIIQWDLPNPGIEPRSPAFQADTLTSEPPGKPNRDIRIQKCKLDVKLILYKRKERWIMVGGVRISRD